MSKNLAFLLILLAGALCLSGCLYFRPVGPCYGVGCPALTSSQSAAQSQKQSTQPTSQTEQSQPTQNQAAQSQPAQTQAPSGQPDATQQSAPAQAGQNQTAQAQTPKHKKSFFSHLLWWKSNSGN